MLLALTLSSTTMSDHRDLLSDHRAALFWRASIRSIISYRLYRVSFVIPDFINYRYRSDGHTKSYFAK